MPKNSITLLSVRSLWKADALSPQAARIIFQRRRASKSGQDPIEFESILKAWTLCPPMG
jgi:hypothetical protein